MAELLERAPSTLLPARIFFIPVIKTCIHNYHRSRHVSPDLELLDDVKNTNVPSFKNRWRYCVIRTLTLRPVLEEDVHPQLPTFPVRLARPRVARRCKKHQRAILQNRWRYCVFRALTLRPVLEEDVDPRLPTRPPCYGVHAKIGAWSPSLRTFSGHAIPIPPCPCPPFSPRSTTLVMELIQKLVVPVRLFAPSNPHFRFGRPPLFPFGFFLSLFHFPSWVCL